MSYETDIIEIYISNTETENTYWLAKAKEAIEKTPKDNLVVSLVKELRSTFENIKIDNQAKISEPWATLLHAALSAVEWRDIANILIDSALDGGY